MQKFITAPPRWIISISNIMWMWQSCVFYFTTVGNKHVVCMSYMGCLGASNNSILFPELWTIAVCTTYQDSSYFKWVYRESFDLQVSGGLLFSIILHLCYTASTFAVFNDCQVEMCFTGEVMVIDTWMFSRHRIFNYSWYRNVWTKLFLGQTLFFISSPDALLFQVVHMVPAFLAVRGN